MSKISVTPNASGTANFTIASPATNTDRTLTLPDSTGTVVVTSGAQTIEFADGSASTPSITNSGDTNTGMFFPAADTIAFAEGGVEAMRLDASGNVGIGTTSPSQRLHVQSNNGQILAEATGASQNPSLKFTAATNNRNWEIFSWSGDAGQFGIYDGVAGQNRLLINTSGNLQFNSGYGSVATAYGCRAWVNFNGTGTISIRASGNVTSLTDNGTGDYTINFTTAMPDANYSAVGMAGSTAVAESGTMICVSTTKNTSQATGSVRVATRFSDSNATDVSNIGIAIFR